MITSQLALVYGMYLIATASPGPSNLAIMGTAMQEGRGPALALAGGVVTGSLFWAILAATGVAAVLIHYLPALVLLKYAGGLYLLYLAFRAGKSAMSRDFAVAGLHPVREPPRYWALYRQGALMHIGNPKAVIAWIAIISLGLQQDSPDAGLPAIVGGCALIGILVFGSYAIAFSTTPMIALYPRARRGIEALLAAVFAAAGLKLLAAPT
jgi:threonine/homoserine/homoserine lactone efflux protein